MSNYPLSDLPAFRASASRIGRRPSDRLATVAALVAAELVVLGEEALASILAEESALAVLSHVLTSGQSRKVGEKRQ